MRLRFLGGIGLVVAVAACSSSAPRAGEASGQTTAAIQGGATDTKDTYAVGVCGGSPGQCALTCSGALIAPNLVISARHCVDDSPSQIDCSSATFGGRLTQFGSYWITTSSSMKQGTTGWHSVKQIITPTPTAVCGNDLSLLILDDVISASEATPITPEVQYPMTDHNRFSTSETAIGYGLTSAVQSGPDTSGTRRIKQNIAVVCIPGDPNANLDCDKLGQQAYVAESEFEVGDGTCEGDSGSSAYEQGSYSGGTPISLGVLSRGGVDPQDATHCMGGIYTRLDKWRDLIVQTAQTAAAQGGYPVPAWTAPAPVEPDAGVTPAKDSGTSPGTPVPGELGAPCEKNSQCTSGDCASAPGSSAFVCSQACDPNAAGSCPTGFVCKIDSCFAGTATPTSPQTSAQPDGSTSAAGCAIGLMDDPTRPLPWSTLFLGATAALARVRRRRPRDRREDHRD